MNQCPPSGSIERISPCPAACVHNDASGLWLRAVAYFRNPFVGGWRIYIGITHTSRAFDWPFVYLQLGASQHLEHHPLRLGATSRGMYHTGPQLLLAASTQTSQQNHSPHSRSQVAQGEVHIVRSHPSLKPLSTLPPTYIHTITPVGQY